MSTLFGQQIKDTYPGLIKTTDNNTLGVTEKEITDGLGNASTLSLGTTSASFTGDLDLSGATVTGLPDNNTTYDLASAQDALNVDINLTGSDATVDTVKLVAGTNITLTNAANQITIDAAGGAAGLVAGTGANSMKNADALVAVAAIASGPNSIALGNGAAALGGTSNEGRSVAIGFQNLANQRNVTVIGNRNTSANDGSVTIGSENLTSNDRGVIIGVSNTTNGTGQDKVQIGTLTTALSGDRAIAIGRGSISSAANGVAIGNTARVLTGASSSVVIGSNAVVNANHIESVAIGVNAAVNGQRSVAVGRSASTSANSVALGNFATATGTTSIAITCSSLAANTTNANNSLMIVPGPSGCTNNAAAANSITIGSSDTQTERVTSARGIAIGFQARATAADAVALGPNIVAATANTVTINRLQILDYAAIDYVDDTAAAAGGIPLGGVYHNAGALRIRIV